MILSIVFILSFFKEPSLLIKQMDHILKPEGMIMIDLYNSLNKKNLRWKGSNIF